MGYVKVVITYSIYYKQGHTTGTLNTVIGRDITVISHLSLEYPHYL
jgi:hypothetical protein